MPTIIKPLLPADPRLDQLKAKFTLLGQTLRAARDPNGAVSVRALDAKLRTLGEPAVVDAFESLKKSLGTKGAPALTAAQTSRALDAVEVAKRQAASFDKNRDGALRWDEVRRGIDEPWEKMVRSVVFGAHSAVETWAASIYDILDQIRARKLTDQSLVRIVKERVSSPDAQQAILWTYRARIAEGEPFSSTALLKAIGRAETRTRIPFLSRLFDRKHFNDAETKAMLGTQDLRAHAAEMRRRADAASGGPFESSYLRGKDIPGVEVLQDLDFVELNRIRGGN